jgi:hypothetical protein
MKKLIELTSNSVSRMQSRVELADRNTAAALLSTAVKDAVADVITAFKTAGDVVKAALDALAKTAKTGIGAVGFIGENWPWLLLGGAALFYVLPTLTKTTRAYRKGGFEAGSAALEEDLLAARQAAAEAAKKAAAAAKKAGMVYATGNPAAAMAGMRKRRRRRR